MANDGAPAATVALGIIAGTHGIRGEVRMLPYNPDTTALQAGVSVTLCGSAAGASVKVLSARRHKRFVLLVLEGITSATAAERLRGMQVCIPARTLPALPPGEMYHFELVGLDVVTTAGRSVGTVREVLSTAANDICVVKDGEREVLIPMIADVVSEVDTVRGRLVITPLPGLIEDSDE